MTTRTTTRRLALHRETLRTLDTHALDGIHGGGTTTPSTVLVTKLIVNDTVYRPGHDKPGVDDTVYRGGGKIIPV